MLEPYEAIRPAAIAAAGAFDKQKPAHDRPGGEAVGRRVLSSCQLRIRLIASGLLGLGSGCCAIQASSAASSSG
jgi:hypothetical protein